ncbi:MAG: TetR/AcrR family transcriptional regulator [Actinobacteria bacterium]|nr:TetR/AcrR family transcriptional regulator [Actinomycetota bacterium]
MNSPPKTKEFDGQEDKAKPKRRPGRPRDASYEGAILKEALREISDHGIRRFSVQRVADRAEVAKATVRLRWPDREELIMAALTSTKLRIGKPDTGTLRGDLTQIVREWAAVYNTEEMMRLYGHVQAEQNGNPEFFEWFQEVVARPANQIVIDAIAAAQQAGRARSDIQADVIARCLVGSLYLEGIARHSEITVEFQQELVALILGAIEAEPHGGGDRTARQVPRSGP